VAAERAAVEALFHRVAGVPDEEAAAAPPPDGAPPAVLLRSLWKVYSRRGSGAPKAAVRDLSLRVRRKECFGLLGVNGAGKTSTIRILAGFHAPTAGEARVDGADVEADRAAVFRKIGYCPQTDPLLDWMSARELLHMYGHLKNLRPTDVRAASEALIQRLGLARHADRPTAAYSGGNKRKASLAIALLGSPAVILLDEPSSGMDAMARRHMWDELAAEARRRAVVLTSHSMEECEALCHRVGVIAGGKLRALGGLQHLKSRHGGGYLVELKCAPGRVEDAKAFVSRTFPGATLDEWHGNRLKYLLPRAGEAGPAGGARSPSSSRCSRHSARPWALRVTRRASRRWSRSSSTSPAPTGTRQRGSWEPPRRRGPRPPPRRTTTRRRTRARCSRGPTARRRRWGTSCLSLIRLHMAPMHCTHSPRGLHNVFQS